MEAPDQKGQVLMLRDRRSDHDVTNTVLVTRWEPVWEVVHDSFTRFYPGMPLRVLRQAFEDFDNLFRGRMPGYLGCDTVYHDIQHTLDMTLALGRLIEGHEVSVGERRSGSARRGRSSASSARCSTTRATSGTRATSCAATAPNSPARTSPAAPSSSTAT
jgi:hypothetical protein